MANGMDKLSLWAQIGTRSVYVYNLYTIIHASRSSQAWALNRTVWASETHVSWYDSPSAKKASWKQRSSSKYIRVEIAVRSFTKTSNTLVSNIAWIRSGSSTSLPWSLRNVNNVCGALSMPWLIPGYVGCGRSMVKVSVRGSHERTVCDFRSMNWWNQHVSIIIILEW